MKPLHWQKSNQLKPPGTIRVEPYYRAVAVQSGYQEALPYLQKYQGTRGRWNNNYYQLGYTYYKLGDFTNAVETFNKIIDGENKTAQNAYYHLGLSYIKLDRGRMP
jgi:tetratricopeptide (TPR) repeat protein